MSGDVQPRKRKDKKKKREDDDIRESHHGVHAAKLGTDDVLLHVQGEHTTGGHWCAKILFFSLLAILVGLIGLIIMENRGLSDMDTPLSESRYSEYFEGWVDEHRQSHDEHDKVTIELHDHDEPFEEEEDHSEQDDDNGHDNEHDEDEEDHHEDDNENEEPTETDNKNDANNDDDDEEQNEQQDNDEEEEDRLEKEIEEKLYSRFQRNDNDNDKDDKNDDDNDNESTDEGIGDEIDDTNDDNNDQQSEADKEEDEQESEINKYDFQNENDPFDEVEEDDANDDSLEEVIENDAEELAHLERKAKEQEANDDDEQNDDEEESSSKIQSRTGRQSVSRVPYGIDKQLHEAEDMLFQKNLKSSLKIYESILINYPNNPGALYGKAKVLDRLSDKYQSNHMLNEAIDAYKHFLTTINNDDQIKIDNQTFIEAAERCIDRMRFIGLHLQAVPIHEMLIKHFDDTPKYRNQLAVTYLLINRLSDAKRVLHETLLRWRNDGFAQVHYGFILKNLDKDLIRSVKFLQDGIETNDNGTQDGRFYFHLGDALQRLGRINESKLIYRKGAKLKLFLSEYQRSLYNVNNLKAKPYWTEIETTYDHFFKLLKNNWKLIRDEGLNILNSKGLFMNEIENLKDIGDWKQYELFTRGYKNMKNCENAPITCKLIETFPAARYCKRGQTKFSVMHPNTHVWPHCGPTNCRLRAHLGLKIPSGTKIRVANEERTWQEGEFLIFDDSFEHEVWHNGTELRLVLIVDVWHPELTDEQKKTLTPI